MYTIPTFKDFSLCLGVTETRKHRDRDRETELEGEHSNGGGFGPLFHSLHVCPRMSLSYNSEVPSPVSGTAFLTTQGVALALKDRFSFCTMAQTWTSYFIYNQRNSCHFQCRKNWLCRPYWGMVSWSPAWSLLGKKGSRIVLTPMTFTLVLSLWPSSTASAVLMVEHHRLFGQISSKILHLLHCGSGFLPDQSTMWTNFQIQVSRTRYLGPCTMMCWTESVLGRIPSHSLQLCSLTCKEHTKRYF